MSKATNLTVRYQDNLGNKTSKKAKFLDRKGLQSILSIAETQQKLNKQTQKQIEKEIEGRSM